MDGTVRSIKTEKKIYLTYENPMLWLSLVRINSQQNIVMIKFDAVLFQQFFLIYYEEKHQFLNSLIIMYLIFSSSKNGQITADLQ